MILTAFFFGFLPLTTAKIPLPAHLTNLSLSTRELWVCVWILRFRSRLLSTRLLTAPRMPDGGGRGGQSVLIEHGMTIIRQLQRQIITRHVILPTVAAERSIRHAHRFRALKASWKWVKEQRKDPRRLVHRCKSKELTNL